MDGTRKEGLTSLDKILPPRLEDAGLENCALPPQSIYEAFLKAASSIGCITEASSRLDLNLGNEPDTGPSGPSTAVKSGDAVVVGAKRGEMKMNNKEEATST